MALPVYLAMTGSEFTSCCVPNYFPAWMACHFSPYSSGLSNFPPTVPSNSLLIVNDYIPPNGHDGDVITQQLQQLMRCGNIQKVLLDFQRPKTSALQKLTDQIIAALPCPVCVTEQYAKTNMCPILVPPIDPCTDPEASLGRFSGRELWLELSYSEKTVRITENGAQFACGITPCAAPEHQDSELCCHYKLSLREDAAIFSLYRTADDLYRLLDTAQVFGVSCGIGLYRELFPKK